jgi:hypothetical protein
MMTNSETETFDDEHDQGLASGSDASDFVERVCRNQRRLTPDQKPQYDFIVRRSGSFGLVVVCHTGNINRDYHQTGGNFERVI